MSRVRWGDGERRWGAVTLHRRTDSAWRWTLLLVSASYEDDMGGCHLRVQAGPWTVILDLPPVVPPARERLTATSWDAATIARLGRDWYEVLHRREFGVQVFDGLFVLRYGRQTMDGQTERAWSRFLTWTQWRPVRQSWYGLEGELITARYEDQRPPTWRAWADELREIVARTPTRRFAFRDFDGEVLTATAHIEEREWRFGTSWCAWLSWFRAPRVSRSLVLVFSGEVGREKGSWKGGTTGHAIEMMPGELHEAAFRRYCAQHNLTFLGDQAVAHVGGAR